MTPRKEGFVENRVGLKIVPLEVGREIVANGVLESSGVAQGKAE